jgi:hypothetical protein
MWRRRLEDRTPEGDRSVRHWSEGGKPAKGDEKEFA